MKDLNALLILQSSKHSSIHVYSNWVELIHVSDLLVSISNLL